jgi:photosystem II stability/assembly factor-like uncharacterized protein
MKIYNLAFLLLFLYPFASSIKDSHQKLNKNKSDAAKIVFKSTDGGQTWQDISEGLPGNLKEDLLTNDFFVNETGLHLRANNDGIYHNKLNSTTPFWEKETSPHKQGSLAPAKAGINANNGDSQFVQKLNPMSAGSPIYKNFREGSVRTHFKTAGAAVLIATDRDLFRSTNSGKTWKKVVSGGMGMKLVESNGVILATAENGILRSTDDGENWEYVLSENGIGIALEPIKGGFAAIIASRWSKSTIVRASYDGGETWQPIDAGLPAALGIASIIEVGEYFFCGHPAGIFRSADKGKTWNLLLPSIESKVFNLYVSGNVIYAIPLSAPGC